MKKFFIFFSITAILMFGCIAAVAQEETEQNPAEETALQEEQAEETPAGEPPAEKQQAEETPAEEQEQEEAPAEEEAPEEAPAEATPAEEEQAPEAEKTPEELMMEAFMKYTGPAEEHDFFKFFVGAWDVLIKSWSDPQAEPQVSQGVAEAKLIFDGRFLMVKFRTKFTKPAMEGMQFNGYDLFKQKYFTLWIDNMSTHLSITYGTLDEENKVLAEEGMWPDYMTGGEQKVKLVTTILNEDEYKWQMWGFDQEGQEYLMMENISKRIK